MAVVKPSISRTTNGITVNTQSDIADAYDTSPQTVQSWVSRGMPGKNGEYKLRAISRWLRENQLGPFRKEERQTGDPLLNEDVDSPGLERYRVAKAALAELDLEERRGEIVRISQVRVALSRWSTIIRRLGERLAKRFGNDAATALNEALDECHRVIGYEFCNRASDETTGRDVAMVPGTSPSADSSSD